MKKYVLLFFILILLTGAQRKINAPPTGLMVEFIREPGNIKILDTEPEFSWIIPVSAKFQTAYQILVSASKSDLEKNIGNVWDSKMIRGTISSEVEYGGEKLPGRTTFFWKVRIWNDENKPSGFSDIQSFSTGDMPGYATTINSIQTTLISPEKFIKTDIGHYFADFGKDAFGTLIIRITPPEIDTIIIHLGEKLSGTATIDRNPGGTIRYQRVLLRLIPGINEYKINLPIDKRHLNPAAIHLPDSFGVITPFRYCELENVKTELKKSDLCQKAFWYYFDDKISSFTSSDTILNKVWDICKYSIKATSFAGIYVDGDRERIPYEADAYINQMGHYCTDREYSLARISNEYFIKHPTWPTEWILHTVPMFYYDYLYTGNIESVKNFYEDLKFKTLVSLAREDGLINSRNATDEIMTNLGFSNAKDRIRDIVDWPPSQKDTGWKLATPEGERDGYEMVEINTMVNAFYYRNLVLMSELAGYLGKSNDSALYNNLAQRVKKIINKKLFDREKGIYLDGEFSRHSSLHANIIPLAFDLVPEEYKKSVIDFIKSRGMACSVYAAQYLLEGLYNAGEDEYAAGLLTATHDRSWWNMIKSGSTITMEAWDMKYKPNSDWNHAWGAAPANIIPRYMWGIQPAEPGFAKAIIRPRLGRLKHSKITVPTIRGPISAEFREIGSSREYLISIPGNMKCDFIIPGEKVIKLTSGKNKVII